MFGFPFNRCFCFVLTTFLCVLLGSTGSVSAAALTWTGTTSSSWNDASNWSPNENPDIFTSATIPAGTPHAPTATGVYAFQVTVDLGATLTGTIYVFFKAEINGTMTGTIIIDEYASIFNKCISGNFDNLINNNTYNIVNAIGDVTVNGTFTNPGGTIDMNTYKLSASTIDNNGTVRTENTSSLPLPIGETWTGTVEYYATSGGQTIVYGTYGTLRLLNSTGTNNVYNNSSINITDSFVTTAGGTFNLGFAPIGGTLTGVSHNGTLITSRVGTSPIPFPSGKTWGGTVEFNGTSSQQFIPGGIYNNLILHDAPQSKSASGALEVNGIFFIGNVTLNMGSNIFSGNPSTLVYHINSALITTNTSSTPIPAGKTWGPVQFTRSSGGQTIPNGTFYNLTMSNTSGTNTASGNINIINTATLTSASGATFDMSNYTLSGSSATFSNTGILRTADTSGTPIPANQTWGGTVVYSATTGRQTVVSGVYNNLTFSNSSNTINASGNITINSTLITTAGGVLDMGIHNISGSLTTISNSGMIRTASSSNPPVPTGETWNGSVEYYATPGGQTIANGTYTNLTLLNTSGTNTVANNTTITISGTLVTTAGGTWNLGFAPIDGTLTNISNSGILMTRRQGISPLPFPSGKIWGGTIRFNNGSGGQSIPGGTYTHLTLDDASGGSMAANGTLTVNGVLNIGDVTLDMGNNLIAGNPSNIFVDMNGVITTTSLSSTPLPDGETWGGTVNYTRTNGGQTIVEGQYYNLTLSHTSGTNAANGNISVNNTAILTSGAGAVLDMNIYTLLGSSASFTHSGTLKTASTSPGPIPSGETWDGTIEYDATGGGQTIVNGIYNNLTLGNTSGTQSLNGTTTIGGTLTMSGGKLTLGSNTLNINGTLSGHTAASSFIANGSSSNISIGGSGALGTNLFFDQTTPGTSNRLNNLTYNRSSQNITLGNALQVRGIVTPTAGTLATANMLTLVSTATNTASIAAGSASYITGNVTAERYITSIARRWRFLASPVIGSTLADWQNEIFITGTGGAANGFDATQSNQPGVYTYDESIPGSNDVNGWVAATNTGNSLNAGKGFRVFIRGDRSDLNVLNGTNITQAAVTMNAIGAVNTGNITMPVTYTNSGNNINDGWNLVGNPYPSAVNWNTFHDAGRSGSSPDYSGTDYARLDAVVTTYDPNTNSYVSYNAVSNIGTGVLSNGIIPSGAAFWVKASGASPSMTLKEIYKTSATPAAMFKEVSVKAFTFKLIKDAITSNEIVVKYIPDSDHNFDAYDIAKLNGGDVNISCVTENGTLLSADCKPFNGTSDSILLNISVSESGKYVFESHNVKQLSDSLGIYLVDACAHTIVDLNATPTYTFSIDKNDASTFGSNRFMIIVGNLPLPTSVQDMEAPNHLSLYPTYTNGEVIISRIHDEDTKATATITDAMGKEVASYTQIEWIGNKISLDLSGQKAGIYFITITSNNQNAVLKCIKL